VCFPLCCCFCVSAGFQVEYSGRVSCSSQLVFEVFIGVHGLALIRVRFLFPLLCPPPCTGGCLYIGSYEAAIRTSHMHLGHSYEIFIILRTDSTKNCFPSFLIHL